MSVFDRFERAIRSIMQGPFQRISSQVQEQEILDALRKAMDDGVREENGRQIAPGSYIVRINPQDFQGLSSQKMPVDELTRLRSQLGLDPKLVKVEQLADLATRVQFEMRTIANNQGYLLANAMRVSFQPDASFSRGRIAASVAPAGQQQQPAGAGVVDHTNTLMAAPVGVGAVAQSPALGPQGPRNPAQITPSMPPAWLTLILPSQGQPFRLDRTVIKIGRGDGNDIVINEKRVSRAHAEIRYEHGIFTIHDMISQNGVSINNVKISRPAPLKDRDRIKICNYEFVFQLQRR